MLACITKDNSKAYTVNKYNILFETWKGLLRDNCIF